MNTKIKHGCARIGLKTSAYLRWVEMIGRCTRPSHKRYADYGGRGITVCERWRDFNNFLADMGEPPADKILDRLNNDGNYEPGNCAWRTRLQSQRNTRRSSFITHEGITKTMAEWAEETGIKYTTIRFRKRKGLSPAEILKPVTL